MSGKHLIEMNARNQLSVIQNDMPMSLIFSGRISVMSINGSDRIPQDAMNITNEKEATGIKLNVSTLYCRDRSMVYTPSTIKPSAVKMVEIANKNCKQ